MSEWTPNQIRELIEQAIKAERHLRDRLREEDRRQFEEHRKRMSEALKLQAIEYERRLAELNNEARRIHAVISSTVSQDTWHPHLKAFNELRERVVSQDNSKRETAIILGVVYSSVMATIAIISILVTVAIK